MIINQEELDELRICPLCCGGQVDLLYANGLCFLGKISFLRKSSLWCLMECSKSFGLTVVTRAFGQMIGAHL